MINHGNWWKSEQVCTIWFFLGMTDKSDFNRPHIRNVNRGLGPFLKNEIGGAVMIFDGPFRHEKPI